MKVEDYLKYNKRLTTFNEMCLLLIKFIANFNDSLLFAEFTQFLYKFWGITINSSIIVWGYSSILYFFLSPFIRAAIRRGKYTAFLKLMIILSILFFLNALQFINLWAMDGDAANLISVPDIRIYISIVLFALMDFTNMVYESIIFEYMSYFVRDTRQRRLNYLGIVSEKTGKVIGAFVCALYIVLGQSNSTRFSDSFFTNMQFTFYLGACLNIFAVVLLFLFWPTHFNLNAKIFSFEPQTMTEALIPGRKLIANLSTKNRVLLFRYFIGVGLFQFICVSLTPWISDKFMWDYPEMVLNSYMQSVDVGTSWGSISLTIFYLLWGITHVIVHPILARVLDYSRAVSRIINLFGFLLYLVCFLLYNQNVVVLVVLQGFGGLCNDWLIYEKIRQELIYDNSLIDVKMKNRRISIQQIFDFIEFLSSIVFYIIVPLCLWYVPDRYQFLFVSISLLGLGVTVPTNNKADL